VADPQCEGLSVVRLNPKNSIQVIRHQPDSAWCKVIVFEGGSGHLPEAQCLAARRERSERLHVVVLISNDRIERVLCHACHGQ
jgi:hypothetical protein